MSKLAIAILSFFLGGGFGVMLGCCVRIGKESEENAKKSKFNKR